MKLYSKVEEIEADNWRLAGLVEAEISRVVGFEGRDGSPTYIATQLTAVQQTQLMKLPCFQQNYGTHNFVVCIRA